MLYIRKSIDTIETYVLIFEQKVKILNNSCTYFKSVYLQTPWSPLHVSDCKSVIFVVSIANIEMLWMRYFADRAEQFFLLGLVACLAIRCLTVWKLNGSKYTE